MSKNKSARPLAEWAPDELAQYLREIGEDELAQELSPPLDDEPVSFGLFDSSPKPWQHTAHSFGYIALKQGGEDPLPIVVASAIEGDRSLVGAAVKVTLDRLHVADYPGGGTHTVALEFEGQNQAADRIEPVQFTYAAEVRQGSGGAVGGWPVFVGMRVGAEGLAFRCRTINVKNSADEQLMGVLQSKLMRAGLSLAETAQPALVPFTTLIQGMIAGLVERRKNVVVQDFELGLDFSQVATRAHLRAGSYVAVQVADSPDGGWSWADWVWSRDAGRLVNRADPTMPVPFNYLVFSISPMALL